ncbi:MAG: hypothetical protein J6U02_02375 [Elusimicrobia bacterium]|nr:hypothetical protein [Elusimicrobiota bacterium]
MKKKIAGLLSLIVLLGVSVFVYAAEPLRVLSAFTKFPSVIVPTITHTAIETASSIDRIINAKISVDFGSYTQNTATAKIKYSVDGGEIQQQPPGEGIQISNNEEFFIQLPTFLESAANTNYQIVVEFRNEQGEIVKTVAFPSETEYQQATFTDTVTKDIVSADGGKVEFCSGNQQYANTNLEIARNALSSNAQIIIKQLGVEDYISSTEQMVALYKVYSVPENIEILAPIKATFYYGINSTSTEFVLKYKKEDSDKWNSIPVNKTDLQNKTVMTYISNLGYYGIFEKTKQEDTDYRPKTRVRVKSRISTYGGYKFKNLKEGDVVKIYTVNGKKIAELTAGDAEGFEWRGRKGTNNSGDWAESGTYVYQIKVKGKVISGTIAFVW